MLPLLLVPVLAAPVVQPPWIQVLPVQPGRVYGLGVAPLAGAEAAAVREASDNGRADVIARLRANVKADTRITTTTVETRGTGAAPAGTRTQSAQVGTEVQAQAADLPGLVVEETWLDRPGRTGYALAYLDLGIAQRELRTRLATLRQELAAGPDPEPEAKAGIRARLVRVQALKKAHAGLVQLDDLAGLLSGGGGDPDLRGEVLKTRLDTERQLLAARASLTFGLAPSPGLELDPEVAAAVRTAVLKEGMGWSRADPMFAITLRVKTGRSGVAVNPRTWWDYQRSPDFIIAQGALSLSLEDRAGEEYESVTINAKGVGINQAQADALLQADYRAKLGKAVAGWLADLGGW